MVPQSVRSEEKARAISGTRVPGFNAAAATNIYSRHGGTTACCSVTALPDILSRVI
jgi:hypothetical protein